MPGFFKRVGGTLGKPHVWQPIVVVIVGVLVGLLCYWALGRWLDGLVIGAALIIIGLMVVVLRSFFAMEREDRLGRGLDDPNASPAMVAASGGVEDGFARAVEEIRGSRLGVAGIESLPWLLMLGERGEGKTAAVRECGFELPAEYATRVSGAPTRACDWWFTNDAIILDLAGRYLACDDDETRAEWQTVLRLLRRQRPNCALNGVIFTISTDSLLQKSTAELDEVARSLRRRVNEATDELGVDLPIYVLVTKVDHIDGFVECMGTTPVAPAQAAIGWTNDQRVIADTEEKVVEELGHIVARLESVLPELLLREPDPIRRRRIFSCPEDFEAVIRALGRFVGRSFAATPYDAPPYLRGVYFTSARREGGTISPKLHRLGQDWAQHPVENTLAPGGRGLADVFREVIVGDRDLALPIDRFGGRTRFALNIAAGFVFALVALWWLVSFTGNLVGIRRLQNEAESVIAGSTSLQGLDAMRAAIVEESEEQGVLRRGGLAGPMTDALENARTTYAWGFAREFEDPAKRKLMAVVRRFDEGAFEALAQLATDVPWLVARGQGEDAVAPELASYAPISTNPSDVEAFERCYQAFVAWGSHADIQARIDEESAIVADASAQLLELQRLERWAEGSRSFPPARYDDAGLPGVREGATQVSGAYTRKAWEGLVVRLLSAIEQTGTASNKAKIFTSTYVKRFDEQWRAYLLDAPIVATENVDPLQSPYLDFLRQLDVNTGVELKGRTDLPPWVRALQEARRSEPLPSELAAQESGEDEKGDGPPPPPWKAYREALELVKTDAAAAASDGEVALDLAGKMAKREGTNFELALAHAATMVPSEGDPVAAKKLRALIAMPILDSASMVLGRALAQLDRSWRATVVEPNSGALTNAALADLYSQEGSVAAFRQGALAPFFKAGEPTRVIGDRTLPFGPAFLSWLKSAERLQRVLGAGSVAAGGITVRLKGIPSSVSPRHLHVASRELLLRCPGKRQDWAYYEGGGQGTFAWSPSCDELTLRITVLDNGQKRELAAKRWTGPMALPGFLRDGEQRGEALEWNLDYPSDGVQVQMRYKLLTGSEVRALSHSRPPASMRN